MRWLADTLAASRTTWKLIFSHHLVGGGLIDPFGEPIVDGGRDPAYARGSAADALRAGTDQAVIHGLLRQHGAQFFIYGHDHAFYHGQLDGVNYVCIGRPTWLSNWWSARGMLASYGSLLTRGRDHALTRDLLNVLGYARFEISPEAATLEWVRTGFSLYDDLPSEYALRDWRECWAGRAFSLDANGRATLPLMPTDVDGARTIAGANVRDFYSLPDGPDHYPQPDPPRPEAFDAPRLHLPGFPESTAVIDVVPDIVYRVTFSPDGVHRAR